MKNLFYRLSSIRSFAKFFSNPMHAQFKEGESVMFPKNSVFAVLALAALVSLGALLFPQAGHAQCIWDCELGSDFNFNPADNSPGFSIGYCFDQGCVAKLKDSKGNFLFTTSIPNASVKQDANLGACDGTPSGTITIVGNVVAVRLDTNKNAIRGSAAEAFLNIVVKNPTCTTSSDLSRIVTFVKQQEPPADVFDVSSQIKIKFQSSQVGLGSPNWGGTGCPTNNKGILTADCIFPLGIDVSQTDKELSTKFPGVDLFAPKEVYKGIGVGRFVGMRLCKGEANQPPSSIACKSGNAVLTGGFDADAVFNFDGNWSGSGDKTFNPKSGTGPFDIITEAFDDIVLTDPSHPVTASANGGTPITGTGCSPIPSQGLIRCTFPARDLLPGGCKTGTPVNIVVSGNVFSPEANREVKFLSTDSPTCNNSK